MRYSQTHSYQQGFNLVELMVVLGVIGVLASIALPMYMNYVAKSSHAAGIQELSPGKMQIEINLNEGIGSFSQPEEIGLPNSTNNCSSIEVTANALTGEATLSCTLQGNMDVLGAVITLKRTPDGSWSCESTANSKFVDGSCVSTGG
ncbi:MAG: pilin [Methylococcaceae bacterium]